jgi:hypothetical protein
MSVNFTSAGASAIEHTRGDSLFPARRFRVALVFVAALSALAAILIQLQSSSDALVKKASITRITAAGAAFLTAQTQQPTLPPAPQPPTLPRRPLAIFDASSEAFGALAIFSVFDLVLRVQKLDGIGPG